MDLLAACGLILTTPPTPVNLSLASFHHFHRLFPKVSARGGDRVSKQLTSDPDAFCTRASPAPKISLNHNFNGFFCR